MPKTGQAAPKPNPNEYTQFAQLLRGVSGYLTERKYDLGPSARGMEQGPQPQFGEGVHPEALWAKGLMQWAAAREAAGKTIPSIGPISEFVSKRLGYLPSYWEDPYRIGKWYHKLQAIPDGAPLPDWLEPDKLKAAYRYLEEQNKGTPWWDWKFLHPGDPARSFLQGLKMPPPEALYPEEMLYTPGMMAEQPSPGPPLPGTPEWDKLDIWQKVMTSVFGSGPELGEGYTLGEAGHAFGRGFIKGAPSGAVLGIFTGPGALVGGLTTGLIGGIAELGLARINELREEGQGFSYDVAGKAVITDVGLEKLLYGALGLVQYPAEIAERVLGTGHQLYWSGVDPERYGPVAEVLGGLRLEWGARQQGLVGFLPYIGGPTGHAAGLYYETPGGLQRSVSDSFDWLSAGLAGLVNTENPEEYTPLKVDEVWDLGAEAPRKIGDNLPQTSGALAAYLMTEARRAIMTTDLAPRDMALAIGQRYGISGILSDLILQAVLDPLNLTPAVEYRTARGIATESGLGGYIGRLAKVGETDRVALLRAIEMVEAKRISLGKVKGLSSLVDYVQGRTNRGGGIELIRHMATILRTSTQLMAKPELVEGLSTFGRYLAGVTKTGELAITVEPTGILGRLLQLTPKSRATKFLFTGHDVIKAILGLEGPPELIAKRFLAVGSGDAQAWQKLGIDLLGTPDGHYPVLAMRDFNSARVKGFLEVWKSHEPTRNLLTAISELMGHEDPRTTLRMFRDYKDAAWNKLGEIVRQQVGAGNERAMAIVRLIDQGILTKAQFDQALKGALTGAVPLTVDHFRFMLYDAWLDHVTKWVVENFNVQIEPMLYRLSNALKQGASLVLLDGNPGYLFANFWNNVATTFIDGSFGFNRIDRIVRYFEEDMGLIPSRLEQAFGGPGAIQTDAGLVLKGDIAKLTLTEAMAKGVEPIEWVKAREARSLQVLAEKTTGHGAIAMLDRALGSLRQKPGQTGVGKYSPLVISRLSSYVERFAGANAFYRGTRSWMTRAWRRVIGFDKLPTGIESAIGPELAERIYGVIEGTTRYSEIEAALLEDGQLRPTVHQFAEGVSRGLGGQVAAADVLAMLDEADVLPVIEAELPRVKTRSDLNLVFTQVEDKLRAHINEMHVLDLVQKANGVAEALKIGDLTGIHDTWIDLNARLAEWWTEHVMEWGNTVEEADRLFAEGDIDSADAMYRARLETAKGEANRVMEMQTAVIDGLVDGLREQGIEVGDKYALGLRTQIAEWRQFFNIRDALWEEYGAQRAAGTLPTGRYSDIVAELTARYSDRAADDLYLQEVMDRTLVEATARVNLRSATALNDLLAAIREHKAVMYAEEMAVRDAVHELWNLTTGAEAADVLRRNIAGHADLMGEFEVLVNRWMARRSELTARDVRAFRRQVYDLYARKVKVRHIRDYYGLRSEGMVDVLTERRPSQAPSAATAAAAPPEATRPARTADEMQYGDTVPAGKVVSVSSAADGAGAWVEQNVGGWRAHGGVNESGLVHVISPDGTQLVWARPESLGRGFNTGPTLDEVRQVSTGRETPTGDFEYSRDVTLDELRRLALDAGIATATKAGQPFDGHLLNVLNKDLGLNGTPLKLKNLTDLANLQREGGAPGDSLQAARQLLVNRGVRRLRYRQEAKVSGLTVEALEAIDAGLEAASPAKLRKIAEANGLSEAGMMEKAKVFEWMAARRARLVHPFDAATPEAIKTQIREAMVRSGWEGADEVADAALAIWEARAKAIGMTVPEFLRFRQGIDTSEAIYTFQQQRGSTLHPWAEQLANVWRPRGVPKGSWTGFLLTNGESLALGSEAGMTHIYAIAGLPMSVRLGGLHEFMLTTGTMRVRKLSGGVDIDIRSVPTPEQLAAIVRLATEAGEVRIEYFSRDKSYKARILKGEGMTEALSEYLAQVEQDVFGSTSFERMFQMPEKERRPIYSWMGKLVEAKMPERMAASELMAFLEKNGVKAEEIRWTLLEELIERRKSLADMAGREGAIQRIEGDPVIEKSEVLALVNAFEPQIIDKFYPGQPTRVRPAIIQRPRAGGVAGIWLTDMDTHIMREAPLPGTPEGRMQPVSNPESIADHLAGGWTDDGVFKRRGQVRVIDRPNEYIEFDIQYEVDASGLRAPRYVVNVEHTRYPLGIDRALAARSIIGRPQLGGIRTDAQVRADPNGRPDAFPTLEAAMEAAEQWQGYEIAGDEARWERYTYPGGSNYRELVVHLPTRMDMGRSYEGQIMAALDLYPGIRQEIPIAGHEAPYPDQPFYVGDAIDYYRRNPETVRSKYPELAMALDTYAAFEAVWAPTMRPAGGVVGYSDYISPHFSDPNYLAHARIKDRWLPDGRRVLFMEELQSDFGQQARSVRHGQKLYDLRQERSALVQEQLDLRRRMGELVAQAREGTGVELLSTGELRAYAPGAWEGANARLDEIWQRIREIEAEPELSDAPTSRPLDPPLLPFEKTWHELALKKLIRLAAEEGYDGFMWNDADGVFRAETQTDFEDAPALEARRVTWIQEPNSDRGHLTIEDADGGIAEQGVFDEAEARHLVGEDVWETLDRQETVVRDRDRRGYSQYAEALGLYDRDVSQLALTDWKDQGGPEEFAKYTVETEDYGTVEIFEPDTEETWILRTDPSDEGVSYDSMEKLLEELDSYHPILPDGGETIVREDLDGAGVVGMDDGDFFPLARVLNDDLSWTGDEPELWMPEEIELWTTAESYPEEAQSEFVKMHDGFMGFYENIVPNVVKKLVKPWGVGVEETNFIGAGRGHRSRGFRVNEESYYVEVDAPSDGSPGTTYRLVNVVDERDGAGFPLRITVDEFRNLDQIIDWSGRSDDVIGALQQLDLAMRDDQHPGYLVPITPEMREGNGPEFRLFQEANEAQVRERSTQTRRALIKAINDAGIETGVLDFGRILNGEDIRTVLAYLGEVPEPVFKAWETWREATQDARWLDQQPRMFQGPKAATDIGRDGRAVMRFLTNPDPSSVMHEGAHIFMLDLLPSEMDAVHRWLTSEVKRWGGQDISKLDLMENRLVGRSEAVRQGYEAFARGFEKYMAEGVAPSEGLKAVFEKFKQWLLSVYQAIVGSGIDVPLSDAMRQLYGDILGGRAPDFDIANATWKSIEADAVAQGRPRTPMARAEAAPEIVPPETITPPEPNVRIGGYEGAENTARGPDPGVSYRFRYRIMDLDEPLVSHDLSGNMTEGYPKGMQPRDRTRAASLRQSQDIAEKLNPPALLDHSARIDDGSPIIESSGVVSSGNGRMNGLRIAARDLPQNYAAYRRALVDKVRAGEYGPMPLDQVQQIKRPVLVRENLEPARGQEIAKASLDSGVMGMSAIEQAALDVSRITESMLETLVINEGQAVQDALLAMSNRQIVRDFVKQLPRSEQAEALTRNGEPTRQVMDRMLAAMFMFVYGDAEAPDVRLRLAERIFESADPVLKNVTGAMMAVAGDMAKAEALIRANRRPAGLSIVRELVSAVEELVRIKEDPNLSVEDYLAQGLLLGFARAGEADLVRSIIQTFEQQKRSMKAIREVLQGYARAVIAEPETGQMGLLGPHEYPTRLGLWQRVTEAPASEATLFQLPEQMPMRGYFDQTPGIGENSARSAEGYRNMLSVMDELREQMGDGTGQEVKSEDVRNRLSEDQKAEFRKWVKGLEGKLSGTKFSAVKWGEDVRNFSLLDYTALRGVDTHFLGIPFNYAFWPTRQVMRHLLRFIDFPALMANYARLNEARRKQEERPGFPSRLKGKVYIPIPWMPEWMGDGLWVDPIRQFFPPAMFLDSFDRIQIEQNRVGKRTEYILQKWVESGDTTPEDAQAAIQTQSGELWDMALEQAKTELQKEFQDPLDYVQLLTGLSLPVSIAHEYLRGTPERIQPLPLTRWTKTATSAFAQWTGIGNPEGVNIEGPIREALDLPRYDRFEDYRVDRMLSTMMAEDPSITRQALIEGIEKSGSLYDEATRRVNAARNFGIYANPLFFVFGLGGDTFPDGEARQRKLSEEFGLAITARDLGDSTALNRFFEKYPEYEGRLASFDTPEERFRSFLIDEVWVNYNQLGSANKELARNQLGQDFQELFLSKETRSYGDVPVETLAAWAHVIGGYVPENAPNRIEYKELLPPLLQLPPEAAGVIDTFRTERNERFPNWFAVQQGYFTSGPSRSAAREEYLGQWPELQDYWDWRDDQLDGNDFLRAYYERYDLEGDQGSLGSLGVPDIVTNPILMRQLLASEFGGQPLTSGALEELRRIYDMMGSGTGQSFLEWVDGLDVEGMSQQAPAPGGGGYQALP